MLQNGDRLLFVGPQASSYDKRIRVVDQIVHDLFATYGDDVVAIGLYGSMARGDDGPYSDIELFCVVRRAGLNHSHEWVHGEGKAEVNLYGEDVMQMRAVTVTDRWPLRQNNLYYVRPLYGELAYFEQLKSWVLAPPKAAFDAVIREMIVGELYEWIGKARNARERGSLGQAALLACHFVEQCALMLGMAHRTLYTTGATMLEESLALPNRPDAYADLCACVMQGDLRDMNEVASLLERVFAGLEEWTNRMGIDMSIVSRWPFAQKSD